MIIKGITVSGEPVRLIQLPKWNAAARAAWARFVASDSIFGLDVESTAIEGLGVYDSKIKMRMIQFGTPDEGWALDPTHPGWRRLIIELLQDQTKRFVSHNASFDSTRVLYEFAILLGDRSLDTLPMASMLWPGHTRPRGNNLKALSDDYIDDQLSKAEKMLHARFTDLYMAQKPRKTRLLPLSFVPGESLCRATKKQNAEKCQNVSWIGSQCGLCYDCWLNRKTNKEAEKWGWRHIEITDPLFLDYAGMDAVYVRILLMILNQLILKKKMGALSRTEQRIKRQMTAVSVKGYRVDLDWTEQVLKEVGEVFDLAGEEVMSITGLKPRSNKMAGWFKAHGLRVTSLDQKRLPGLIEKYGEEDVIGPVLTNLGVISEHSNLINNLRIIWHHVTEGDGLVHASINTQQAHTGRMSATQPAMQTFAKKGEKGARLRGCFLAREGHVLVGADYDSQEVRIMAALSQDPALLKIVLGGLNQHVLTAQSLFPAWEGKEQNPDMYAKAKGLDFAQQYGAFPKTIARSLGVSEREATILWQRWRHTYRGLVQWSDRQAKKRYVRNPFGRVIPRDPHRDYASGNYMVQSTGRDVLGAALCRLEDAGWASYFWLPMHDEMILEVPLEAAERACEALTELMSTELLGISIPAQGEIIGDRWHGLS